MKFKVGDKVRLTREGIIRHLSFLDTKTKSGLEKIIQLSDGFTIEHHSPELWYCDEEEYRVKEEHLELVPEEPEFEYGEAIEVTNDGNNWLKRIFITKSKECRYVCVDYTCYNSFKNGRQYTVAFYDSARKLKPTLSRKEIAEKFGVSEDFTLVD